MIKELLKTTAILVSLSSLTVETSAQNTEKEAVIRALNNFQEEVTECGVFYELMIDCAKGLEPFASNLKEEAHRTWGIAADIGLSIKLTNDTQCSQGSGWQQEIKDN